MPSISTIPEAGAVHYLFDRPSRFDPRFQHKYIEIKSSSTDDDVQYDEKTVHDDDIPDLCACEADPDAAWTTKFLMTQQDIKSYNAMKVPFGSKAVRNLQRHWKIPNIGFQARRDDFDTGIAVAPSFTDTSLRGLCIAYAEMDDSGCTLTIVHDTKARTTYGICFGMLQQSVKALPARVQAAKVYAFHPLLVPLLFLDLHTEILHTDTKQIYYTYDAINVALVGDDYSEKFEALSVANSELSRKLTWLALENADLNIGIDRCAEMHRVLELQFAGWESGEQGGDADAEIRKKDLENCLALIGQKHRHIKSSQDSNKECIQALVQLLFNLLAQKDNQLNHHYGADMRIIAAVTLIFLPGTFMATLFSASFWNFQPTNDGPIVSKWVWLYWVITFILTLVVWVTWRGYAQMKALSRRMKRRFGRAKVEDEESGRGDKKKRK